MYMWMNLIGKKTYIYHKVDYDMSVNVNSDK